MTAVLLTCAGQRVDIVTAFKDAGGFAIAADLNPLSPALYHADLYVVPPAYDDPAYVPFLAEVITEYDVRLVVPLTDLDPLVLAQNANELGSLVLLPEADVIERTRDKYLTHVFLREHQIDTPAAWLIEELPEELSFPVLVKPRRGFGSRGIFLARDRAELQFQIARTNVPSFVQAFCSGIEFSVDVFCDLDARCLNAIPRTMIESKGGESIKGATVRDEGLIELGRFVAETVGVKGPATIQCFRGPDGRCATTDINLRFGGGFPLPHAAGGGYPALALALARGERPQPRLGSFREDVVMTRYFSEVLLRRAEDGRFEPLWEDMHQGVASKE